MKIPLPPTVEWRQVGRGIGWLLVALLIAVSFGGLQDLGVNEYTSRWIGGMAKIASVVYGGYRISRDVLRIDPSGTPDRPIDNQVAFAILHFARAALIGALAIAICMAV